MNRDPLPGFPAPIGQPPSFGDFGERERPSSIPPEAQPPRFGLHFGLFVLTALSMQATAMQANQPPPGHTWVGFAAYQAASLLGILLVHELGHYVAARIHRVPASPPYFLPLPFLSMFGTFGAVISMRHRIRSRKALLDIGAAGPIAGMLVAIPVMCIGLSMSTVGPRSDSNYMQEGQSLLYLLLKRLVLGPIADDQDVFLHPMAFAGWGGFFLTMVNLLPWGQLDGGHIAFALFGERQHAFARWVRRGLLLVFVYNLVTLVLPVLLHRSSQPLSLAFMACTPWLVWYAITGLLGRFFGEDHPPFEESELDPARQALAVVCLVLFVLLFMPTPIAIY
jgi:membrane-associated protease RseP (regulator of RpoE activity)